MRSRRASRSGATLGAAGDCPDRAAARQRRRRRPIPGRSALAEAAAQSLDPRIGDRRRRRRAGSHLGRASRRSIRSRRAPRRPGPIRRTPKRAARRRRRSSSSIAAGTLVSHWGGPGQGYDWPRIARRHRGRCERATSGSRPRARRAGGRPRRDGGGRGSVPRRRPRPAAAGRRPRAQVLARRQVPAPDRQGRRDRRQRQQDRRSTARPRSTVDTAANEVYVADGHGNHRIVVFDATTGAYKRHWGAYGAPPDDDALGAVPSGRAAREAVPHRELRRVAEGRQVYVCDRQNNRIQVFKKDGTFVKEAFVSKSTLGEGAVWDIAFSSDPQQRSSTSPTAANKKVWVLQPRARWRSSRASAPAGGWPGHFSASAASRWTRRATSTRARPTKASACRSSSSRVVGDRRPAMKTAQPRFDRRAAFAGTSLTVLGVARAGARRDAGRRRSHDGAGAAVRSGSALAEAAAEQLGARQTIGVSVDAQDHVWIIHRPDTLIANEASGRPESADGVCCRQRRRCSSSIRPAISSATGAGPARATNGRRRITASPSTTRATSGSAATTRKDAHVLKFTRSGKFLMQFGTPGKSGGSNDTENFGRVGEDLRRSENQRGVHRRRLRQQARRRHRCRHGQVQALLGRVRQQAGRHRTSAATIPTRRPRSSSARRCTAPSCPSTGSSTSATGRTIASRCSSPTARSSRKCSSRSGRSATARRGTSRSRRTRSRSISTSPTARTRRSTSSIAQSMEILTSFGDGGRQPGPVLRRAQHRDRLEGEHLHDGDVRGPAPAEVRLQRDWRRCRASQGTVVAEE